MFRSKSFIQWENSKICEERADKPPEPVLTCMLPLSHWWLIQHTFKQMHYPTTYRLSGAIQHQCSQTQHKTNAEFWTLKQQFITYIINVNKKAMIEYYVTVINTGIIHTWRSVEQHIKVCVLYKRKFTDCPAISSQSTDTQSNDAGVQTSSDEFSSDTHRLSTALNHLPRSQ